MIELTHQQRELWVDHSCSAGSAISFKGNPPFESETPHMFFVLGTLDNGYFVMVNATSKVEKRKQNLDRTLRSFGASAQQVSVQLDEGSYHFIRRETLIDCSKPHIISPQALKKGEYFALIDPAVEEDFFRPLLQAWRSSPLAVPAHLNQIRPQWAPKGIAF